MREIKFRAWHKSSKTMALFIEPFIGEFGHLYFSVPQDTPSKKWEDGTGIVSGEIVLMQFTGLKDKNGKEIYEGDIVKWEAAGITSVVEWNNGAFRMEANGIKENLFSPRTEKYMEVLGNIYETVELLARAKEHPDYGKDCPECGGYEHNHRANCAAVE